MFAGMDPSRILPLDSRAATFENPTGERGAGGKAFGGRKGAPARVLAAGETVVLADIAGPGTVRHIWMTFPPAPPETMRALTIEVFYNGASEPSVSVPALDFFGLPHGRPVAYHSALTSVQEGRGYQRLLPDAVPANAFASSAQRQRPPASCSTTRSTTRLRIQLPADAG